MRSHGHVRLLAAIGVSTLVLGCGAGSDPTHEATATIDEVQEAFEARDIATICTAMTRSAKTVVGLWGHAYPSSCRHDVRRMLSALDKEKPAPRLVDVTVDDDQARATIRQADGAISEIQLGRQEDDWNLAGLYNASESSIQRQLPRPERVPASRWQPPPNAGRGVSAWTGSGTGARPCPPVDTGSPVDVRGGCKLAVRGKRIDMSADGILGSIPFQECSVSFSLHVDESGSAWVDDLTVDGKDPCRDVRACSTRGSIEFRDVRRAAIVSDGPESAQVIVDGCIDTCIGRFEGEWRLDLARVGAVWRLRDDGGAIGRSGWRMDGRLASRGSALALR